MNGTLGKLAISLTATLALGAGALAGGTAQSVVVMSADLQTVLAYGETRGNSLQYRAQYQPAGTPVKVVVTDEDGDTRAFDGTITTDGGVSLTVIGGASRTLRLELESTGVTLTLEAGLGRTNLQLPATAAARIEAARQKAAAARANARADSSGTNDADHPDDAPGSREADDKDDSAEAGAEAGAQAGTSGARAGGSITLSAPVPPLVPPRR